MITDDTPEPVTAVAGTPPQSAAAGAALATAQAVDVRNAAGTLVEGITVTLAVPGGEAGATLDGSAVAPGRAAGPSPRP